ncbi:MAG TPA: dihydroorotate dehydrogenase electron transfer subunit [Clostridia bacterium]|nr:dihydroorotate dehydrogenase electron transfer subunit [Clostridia bacterium]
MEAYRKVTIFENTQLTKDMYEMKVELTDLPQAGQFYMLRAWTDVPYLPRPFSVCDADGKHLSFLYQKVGKGTEIMTKLRPGDQIDLLGPLGKGYPLEKGSIALIGGGVGIAPLVYLAKHLRGPIDVYLGFKEEAFFTDRFIPYARKVFLSTENGSSGHQGFITELLDDNYDAAYACGNTQMMKSVKDKIDGLLYVSLESHMACGIGACLGCVQESSQGQLCVCKDGPVFNAKEVLFDDN